MPADVLGPGHRGARRVGGYRDPPAAGQLEQGVGLGRVELAEHPGRVDTGWRGDELDRAAREVAQPAGGRHRALEHVVVVAVHRVPGQAEPSGPERQADRGQHPGHLGKSVPGPRQVRAAAVGMPVPLVLDVRPGHTLVPLPIAGIRRDLPAVEQVDVGPQLVGLAVVGRVAGHDGEIDRGPGQRGRLGLPHGPDHGLGHLVGEQFLSPVAAHDADRVPDGGVKVGVAIEQLGPPR